MSIPRRTRNDSALALVRIESGLTQEQLAAMVDVAKVSIARIEAGTMPLSVGLAHRISSELDVSPDWLIQNDPKTPPVTRKGGKWAREFYEARQGAKEGIPPVPGTAGQAVWVYAPATSDRFISWFRADVDAEIVALLEGARSSARLGILVHRIRHFLKTTAETFKPDPEVEQKNKAHVQKLFAEYQAEVEAIGKKQLAELWGDIPSSLSPRSQKKAKTRRKGLQR